MDAGRLKAIDLFSDFSDEELSQISVFAEETSVSAGKELVREGDYSYQFIAIEEGEAEVTRGGEHLADVKAGDFFGEMGVLERERRSATVTAKTPMRLITLSTWDMKRMERDLPEAVARLREVVAERREALD